MQLIMTASRELHSLSTLNNLSNTNTPRNEDCSEGLSFTRKIRGIRSEMFDGESCLGNFNGFIME